MYQIIGKVIGHIEKKNGNKYLVFGSADENKKVLAKYAELWDEVENEIERINESWKLNLTHDDLPLDKQLKFPTLTIVVRRRQ